MTAAPESRPSPPSALPDGARRERDVSGLISVVAAVAAAALVVLAFAWSAPRGFDLTDEGYHLNTLRHAGVAPQGGSQFGSVVRVLTLGRTLNVAGYRLFGLALLLASGAFVAAGVVAFLRSRLPLVAQHLPPTPAVVATALVGSALGYSWLPRTVSYLVLTPALLCVIGGLALLLLSRRGRSSVFLRVDLGAAVAIGCAGGLLFFTKFSSALAGLVLVMLAIVLVRGWRRAAAIASVSGATFVAVIVVLDASGKFSVHELFKRASALSSGSHSASALQNAYWTELRRLLPSTIEGAVSLGLVLGGALLVLRGRRPERFAGALLLTLVGVVGFLHVIGSSRPPWDLSTIIVFSVVGALALVVALQRLYERERRRRAAVATDAGAPAPRPATALRPGRREVRAWVALGLVLLGLPVAGSLGTNTGLLELALSSGALLVLAAVVLCAQWRAALPDADRVRALVAAPLVLVLCVCTFAIGRSLTRDLYRVPFHAGDQTVGVSGVPPLAGLRVDAETRDLVEHVVAAAKPVRPASPILTSTNLEGLAYALDGYVPGSGWIDGSATTCARLREARATLATVPLVIVARPLGKALDACFREVVAGYPDAFDVAGSFDLGPAYREQIGVSTVEVLRRR